MGSVVGEEVGYTIRFEDVSTKDLTRICYMTDGVLFREALIDPLLSRFSVVMVDEAHERSVYTDLLLAILKKICRKRPSFRIIVSSATLDATAFLEFFSSLPESIDSMIVSLEGRAYPVQIAYLSESSEDYVHKAAETVISIHRQVCLLLYSLVKAVQRISAWKRGHPSLSDWSRRNRQVSRRTDGRDIFTPNK
ncbi:P-loop containing nucleoside triphosphate hydrolase protein [Lactifluus subvellereus]|nr:P-loop containing nucleoside triphosphate hydrolase protein [Lactifluus subvellereus]